MTPSEWKNTGQYFNYKGHDVFYVDIGEGPVLLLVHGFPTSSYDWHKMLGGLSQQFRVIALDFMGFGYSAKPFNYTYCFADQADLIEVFCEKKGINTLTILAHDYGDTVVQELLARYSMRLREKVEQPEIQSVTLLNGGILQGGYSPRFIQKILASPLGTYIYPFITKNSLRRNFNAIFGKTKPTTQEINDFWTIINYNKGKRVIPKIIRYLHEREAKKTRFTSALAECPVPLMMINGTLDPISGKNIVNLFRKKVPQAKVFELPDVGHYPQTEAPDKVLDIFLANC